MLQSSGHIKAVKKLSLEDQLSLSRIHMMNPMTSESVAAAENRHRLRQKCLKEGWSEDPDCVVHGINHDGDDSGNLKLSLVSARRKQHL